MNFDPDVLNEQFNKLNAGEPVENYIKIIHGIQNLEMNNISPLFVVNNESSIRCKFAPMITEVCGHLGYEIEIHGNDIFINTVGVFRFRPMSWGSCAAEGFRFYHE